MQLDELLTFLKTEREKYETQYVCGTPRAEKSPPYWYLMGDKLRGGVEHHCPISYVAEKKFPDKGDITDNRHATLGGVRLNLHTDLTAKIIAASDNLAGADLELRKQLLEACAVREREKCRLCGKPLRKNSFRAELCTDARCNYIDERGGLP